MSDFKLLLDRPPKTNGLEIKLYAEVSTIHLTPRDIELLANDAAAGLDEARCREKGVDFPGERNLSVLDYLEGFVVWLGRAFSQAYIDDAVELCTLHGYSPTFIEIVRRALNAGCSTLIIDQDGTTVDDLPENR